MTYPTSFGEVGCSTAVAKLWPRNDDVGADAVLQMRHRLHHIYVLLVISQGFYTSDPPIVQAHRYEN